MSYRIVQRICALLLCAAVITPVFAEEPTAKPEKSKTDLTKVTWSDLGSRVRKGSLSALAVKQLIDQIDAIDYDKMEEELRKNMNMFAEQPSMSSIASTGGSTGSGTAGGGSAGTVPSDPAVAAAAAAAAGAQATAMAALRAVETMVTSSLRGTYNTLRSTYDDLRKGKLQKENGDAVRRLEDGVNQIVAGSEALYLQTVRLEYTRKDAERGVATLDRSLEELRLRQKLGQVSGQMVKSVEQKRESATSQIKQLDEGIKTCKIQLQILMGEEPTGELELGKIPPLSKAELDAMNPERGLEKAKKASCALLAARKTLDDEEENWKDTKKKTSVKSYKYSMAEHSWEAAQLTYQGEVQKFESAFNTLSRTVASDRKVLETKNQEVAYAKSQLEIAQDKFSRGLISQNKMLESSDALDAAQSELDGAKLQLFMDYHNYENAVEYGILSQS